MTCLHLTGGNPLFGEMKVQGSKNAALPILAASVLCEDEIILENLPDITDIKVFQELLAEAGVSLKKEGKLLFVRADQVSPLSGQSETGKKIRSSVLLLGPMLARGLPVDLPYPGGCAIGKRPVDIHLEGLRRMGAEIEEEEERICAKPGVLRGIRYHLPFPSVGATQNLIMAGVFAQGETRLTGCAKEPEVEFLCRTLNHLGARIKGGGTDQVVIQGVKKLRGGYVKIPGDRIAAGTFLLYGAACGGMIEVWGFDTAQLESLYPILKKGGCRLIRLFDRVFLLSLIHI